MIARAALAAAIVALTLGAPAAQESASPRSGTAPASTETPRIVKRSILPDGTMQFDYSDGTTQRVGGPLADPPADGARSESAATSPPDLAPVAPPEWMKDPEANRAFLESVREYYVYRASGLRYRSRVFEWQLFSSRIIFATVIMLVASGIVFAAIQFRAGLKRPRSVSSDAATEIDLSAGSVKVSSPVLGVIILVISLGFFYLYLVYVYPISEIV
jgi:hypothetical protein